jgi:hypothetical protein
MPEMRRFGPGKALDNTGSSGVTWFDIDIAVDADREWLTAWQAINEQTRQALLEPVRLNHYEQLPDGTLPSVRTLRPGQTEDVADLADLKQGRTSGARQALRAPFPTPSSGVKTTPAG